jgi:hypothetical protein
LLVGWLVGFYLIGCGVVWWGFYVRARLCSHMRFCIKYIILYWVSLIIVVYLYKQYFHTLWLDVDNRSLVIDGIL